MKIFRNDLLGVLGEILPSRFGFAEELVWTERSIPVSFTHDQRWLRVGEEAKHGPDLPLWRLRYTLRQGFY
jgi:hypothetical protein